MYLLQCWFNLSDEGIEDVIYDSYALRWFMKINFIHEQVPDATTLLNFRHLLETHGIGKVFFHAFNSTLEKCGYMMRGGTIVDATLIQAPSSTKNEKKQRDPEMCQTKKGNQYYFGMKSHIVEHPFLILKRFFGYSKTVYRGLAKNTLRLHVLFTSANILMCIRAGRPQPA